jgi:CrcB protein
MGNIIAVILGGGLGAICRHGLFVLVQGLTGPVFPFGTLSVNLLGSFLIGFLWRLFEYSHIGEDTRLFIFTGLLGGFTTFSTFTRESFQLMKVGEWRDALIYLAVSNICGVLLVLAGYLAAQKFLATLPR